jgi:hypothetical protein
MTLRTMAAVAALVSASAGPLAAGQEGTAAPPPMLRVTRGTIEARIRALPLPTVLDALARETGADVNGMHAVPPREVSAEFPPLPLVDGLRRLLGAESFTVTTRGSGTETRVVRLSLVGARSDGSDAAPIEAVGDAAVATASDTPWLESPAHLAAEMVVNPDPGVRLEAMRRLVDGPDVLAQDDLVARVMLDDADVGVRREAFDVLAGRAGLRVEQTLALLRREPEAELRRHVVPQLAEHVRRDDAAWSVAAWLADNDPDPDVRVIAADLVRPAGSEPSAALRPAARRGGGGRAGGRSPTP